METNSSLGCRRGLRRTCPSRFGWCKRSASLHRVAFNLHCISALRMICLFTWLHASWDLAWEFQKLCSGIEGTVLFFQSWPTCSEHAVTRCHMSASEEKPHKPSDCGDPEPWMPHSEPTYSLHCSSFLGLPFRILLIYLVKPKKELTMETIGIIQKRETLSNMRVSENSGYLIWGSL